MLLLLTFSHGYAVETTNQLINNENYEINCMTIIESDTYKIDKYILVIFLFFDFFNDQIINFDHFFYCNQFFFKYILKKLLFVLSFP